MHDNRSRFVLIAGFLFWLSVAYFFYRYGRGAALYAAIAGGALVLLFWAVRLVGPVPKKRPARRPPSDLPEMNFSDVKPKDFE